MLLTTYSSHRHTEARPSTGKLVYEALAGNSLSRKLIDVNKMANINLCNEMQKYALNAAKGGHNVLITGQCGTGKTFLLRYMFSILTRIGKGGRHSFQTGIFEPLSRICRDDRVMRRCWFNFHCRVVLLICIVGGCLGKFSLVCLSYFLSPSPVDGPI